MLEQMRKGSKHPIVKGLFVLLAVSFVVWGVGDVFRDSAGSGYVATIGKTGITQAELDNIVRGEVARYQEMVGKSLSEEEVASLGIRQYALGQLIQGKVVAIRAQELGLDSGTKAIAKYLHNNDAFFNEDGKFDKERFIAILLENGLTEEKYIASIKRDEALNTLLETIVASNPATDAITDAVYSYRNETRVADIITLPAGVITKLPEPTETDLVQFYKDNQDNFAVPEYRALTFVTIAMDKIKSGVKFSTQELQDEYNRSLQQYKTEENRNVQQYLFDDEAAAKAAYEKIKLGDVKDFTASQIEIGNITKSSVPAQMRDVIFSLQKDQVSAPVKSTLGWHIFIVKSITAETVKAFEAVKGDIEKDLLEKKVAEEFANFGNQVEDEFAAGKTVEEVASKFELEMHKIPAIDKDGNGLNGNKLPDFVAQANLLPLVFSLDVGAHTDLTLLSDNASYAIARVESISPARNKALDEAKGTAIKMWQEQEKNKLLKAQAVDIVSKINENVDLKLLATQNRLRLNLAQSIKRPAMGDMVEGKNGEPAGLVVDLFSLRKENSATQAYQNKAGNFVIARLKSVVKPDAANDKNGYINLQEALGNEMRDDLVMQYISHLRKQYPVSVREEVKE